MLCLKFKKDFIIAAKPLIPFYWKPLVIYILLIILRFGHLSVGEVSFFLYTLSFLKGCISFLLKTSHLSFSPSAQPMFSFQLFQALCSIKHIWCIQDCLRKRYTQCTLTMLQFSSNESSWESKLISVYPIQLIKSNVLYSYPHLLSPTPWLPPLPKSGSNASKKAKKITEQGKGGPNHGLYHSKITCVCPSQGPVLSLSTYTVVFHTVLFVICNCFLHAISTKETKAKVRSSAF